MNVITIFQNPLVLIGSCVLATAVCFVLSRWLARRPPKAHLKFEKLTRQLYPYCRKLVFITAMSWAAGLFIYSASHFSSPEASLTFLSRSYGLSALVLLFVVLTLGLLRTYFPMFPLNKLLLQMSRGFGLSLFMLAALHSLAAFFGNLDGTIIAIQYLSFRNQLALSLSLLAFMILLAMAATSLDRIIEAMTFPKWKNLHRLVYAAIILTLFHAFLIGSHFADISATLPLVIMWFALHYIFLETGAVYIKTSARSASYTPQRLQAMYSGLILIACAGMLICTSTLNSLQASQATSGTYSTNYHMNVTTTPAIFSAQSPVELTIQVEPHDYTPIQAFTPINGELMHLFVVSEDFTQYEHLHPQYQGEATFTASFTPATATNYYLYAEFYPTGDTEAIAASFIRTTPSTVTRGQTLPAPAYTFEDDDYHVNLLPATPFPTGSPVELSFQIIDRQTGQPVTDVEPYMAAYGHAAMIHEAKQPFLHIHPSSADAPKDGTLTFQSTIETPGKYKIFLQFKHKGEVHTASFIVEAATP